MSDNVVGIIGGTVGIGQYIVNDYVITIAEAEGDYGYTMTITRGTDTQTVTLYGLTPEQYNAMLGYLEQAQAAAQNAAGSASDAYAYLEAAINAANTANTQAGRATQASDTARSYASQAQTAKQGAETAKTDAQTARTQAQGYRQAAEAAATRAESAAGQITGMTAEAETLEPGSPATASFLDGVLSLGIPAGANGADGNGIVSIVKTGTSGNVDTYTITYTNGTTSNFTVTNGVDGAVTSVAGKTGAVTLNAGDVSFDDQQAYNDGTVGAGLANLKSQMGGKQDAPAVAGTFGQVLSLDSSLNPAWVNQQGGGGEVWHEVDLTEADYDADLGMILLDAGDGNRIKEIVIAGQIVNDGTQTANETIAFGFGDTKARVNYSCPASTSSIQATERRIGFLCHFCGIVVSTAFSGVSYSFYPSAFFYNTNQVVAHTINVDLVLILQGTLRATNFYGNFNNPRYFKVEMPTWVPEWASIKAYYTLM